MVCIIVSISVTINIICCICTICEKVALMLVYFVWFITFNHNISWARYITMCKNFLDVLIVAWCYHDINDTLKYCPILVCRAATILALVLESGWYWYFYAALKLVSIYNNAADTDCNHVRDKNGHLFALDLCYQLLVNLPIYAETSSLICTSDKRLIYSNRTVK